MNSSTVNLEFLAEAFAQIQLNLPHTVSAEDTVCLEIGKTFVDSILKRLPSWFELETEEIRQFFVDLLAEGRTRVDDEIRNRQSSADCVEIAEAFIISTFVLVNDWLGPETEETVQFFINLLSEVQDRIEDEIENRQNGASVVGRVKVAEAFIISTFNQLFEWSQMETEEIGQFFVDLLTKVRSRISDGSCEVFITSILEQIPMWFELEEEW